MGYFSRDDDLRYRIAEQVRELSLTELRQVAEFIDTLQQRPKRKHKKHPKKVGDTPPKKTRSKRVDKLVRRKDYL